MYSSFLFLNPVACCQAVAPTQALRSTRLIWPGQQTYIGHLLLQYISFKEPLKDSFGQVNRHLVMQYIV